MEQFPEKDKSNLEIVRSEITDLHQAALAAKAKGEHYNADLTEIDPAVMTAEEAEWYFRAKSFQSLGDYDKFVAEFDRFRKDFLRTRQNDPNWKAHLYILSYIGNQATANTLPLLEKRDSEL